MSYPSSSACRHNLIPKAAVPIEMPQRARTLKVNCCLKVHNAHLKLLSPISGYVIENVNFY